MWYCVRCNEKIIGNPTVWFNSMFHEECYKLQIKPLDDYITEIQNNIPKQRKIKNVDGEKT